jgi:uncharacterized SAM-binding protein YcdF (DUF218 family)
MRGRINSGSLLAGALVAAVVGLLAGFVQFAIWVTSREHIATERADGIVVLTGEAGRIAAGVRLLHAHRAERLLISGVNRRIGRDELLRLTRLAPAAFDCCVDIGYDALTTTGNADEAHAWAEAHRYTSLIVVTASYHMPRSLTELGRLLPGTRLVPHAVVPKSLRHERWWLRLGSTRLLAEEYLKFLPSAARYAAGRLIWPSPVPAAAASGT